MASRSLDDLTPAAKAAAEMWLRDCTAKGLDILVYRTYVSASEQDEVYKVGRTVKGANIRFWKPMGDILTNARGGQSKHQARIALDFVPMISGKPQWKNPPLYLKAGELAETRGFEWAGRWTGSLRETAHIQFK